MQVNLSIQNQPNVTVTMFNDDFDAKRTLSGKTHFQLAKERLSFPYGKHNGNVIEGTTVFPVAS